MEEEAEKVDGVYKLEVSVLVFTGMFGGLTVPCDSLNMYGASDSVHHQ